MTENPIDLPVIPPVHEKPLNSVLIKPSSADCNLNCGYCFYLEKKSLYPETKIHRMSIPIMREMVKQVMQAGQLSVSFGWQGGEPTLMGLDFYRRAVEAQQEFGRPGQSVGNGLQTNGILINDAWCEFLRDYDKYRLTRGGRPSWKRVFNAGKRMLDAGVAVNGLVVVNDYSCMYPEEIYNFLRDSGYEFMQFIPCVETDPNDPSIAAPFSVTAEQYGEFLCRIFDCWKKDFRDGRPVTSVRYIDSVFHTYVDLAPPECTLLEECGIYVVIEHNGDVYSCDFFVDPQWKLGNVLEDNLANMLNSPLQKQFGLVKKHLPSECYECPWLKHCWGGCPKDRLHDPRDKGVNHFCRSYMMFFEHADADLRQLAEDWKAQQQREMEDYQRRLRELHAQKPPVPRVGRNEPCPCGSGKKYKKCCGKNL
ncbi:MAG: anaerobic sulfatase maturase [Candidatus Hinthialibacter sp.]